MPYKVRVTKACKECGNVLESEVDHFCDGCGKVLQNKDYNKEIRIGFLEKDMSDYTKLSDDFNFCNLNCFLDNMYKIGTKGKEKISFEFLSPSNFIKIRKLLREGRKKS